MKIGIDARFVGPQGTGLGKYTEKLIINLSQLDSKNHYYIFLKENNWDYLKLGKNFKKILADVPWYSLAEQIKLPMIFKSQNLDLLHVPHFNVPIFYRGRFIITIHDLIHHQFSESSVTTKSLPIFKIKRPAYRFVINQAVGKAKAIITPSQSVKNEIVQKFGIDSPKVIVTYEAAEEEYFKESQKSKVKSQRLLEKYKINSPFIIYVGNAYPHKNLENLLKAFKILTRNQELETRNLKLILVCPRDVFWKRLQEGIKEEDVEDQVALTGYIPARDLASTFRQAKAYVFPSFAEGFGIPGLNAMAAGLPVVCSNIPTLKEVYDNAALYFDPNDPQDIAEKINQIVSDSKIRSGLIDSGLQQVKKYSWHQMVQETLDVYKTVSR